MSAPAVSDATPKRNRSQSPNKKVATPDPDGLAEYSVVYTNRSLNHMSKKFQQVMRDVSFTFKTVYNAHSSCLVPGSGTYGMEAVARQFGSGQTCLVIRNGYFSYRWSQIFEMGSIPSKEIILKARPVEDCANPAYAPCPIQEVVDTIRREQPSVVFAPHVETSSGIILPESYMKAVADAVHEVGGLFVLDCIASGCVWVDMKSTGVDVLISAPQKGWASSPCVGIVMLSSAARTKMETTTSTSFAVDLKKWVNVMEAYEKGGHMYHATMPTDSILNLRDVQQEFEQYGFARARSEQLELGKMARQFLKSKGIKSLAAEGFEAPGVVVSYTTDAGMKSGAKFAEAGMQIAAGVPLMLDEFTTSSPDFRTWRIGLFGIDKLMRKSETVELLGKTLDKIASSTSTPAARL